MTDVRKLRKQLDNALAKRKDDEAIEALLGLIEGDPKTPRWPHKLGELYQKAGKRPQAVEQYTAAANLYADQGFIARAIAMAKTILELDPARIDVLERIDPEAARRLHRRQRPGLISSRPGAAAPHPALLPENDSPLVHPALLAEDDTSSLPRLGKAAPAAPSRPGAAPKAATRGRSAAQPSEDDSGQAARHPALIPEDDAPSGRHAAILPESEPPVVPTASRAGARRPASPPPAPGPASEPPVLGISDVLDAGSGTPRVPPKAPPPRRPAAPEALGLSDVLPGPPRLPDLASSVIDLADELVIAPDVAPGETRFSNAPPARGVRVDMSAAELTPRKAAGAAATASHRAPRSAGSLSKLPLFPLFAELPQHVLVELVKSSTVVELPNGTPVVRAGEPADALYGIIEGSVDIAVPGQSLKMTLAEGDVFGEACLLPGEVRRASVTVRGSLTAIRLARELLSQIIGLHPPIAEVLLDLLTRRLLTNLLQSAPIFQELDTRGRQHMVELFEIRRAPGGTRLAEIGKTMDGLYITLTGRVLVTGLDATSELHDAGTMFGQSSLLMNQRSDVTITTQSPMLLLRLPAQAFHNAVMQYPGMLAHLSELAGSTLAKVST